MCRENVRRPVPAKGECALGQAVSGGGGDGGRAAHNHVVDGSGGFAKIFRGDNFELMREQPLFDEQDGIARTVEGDGAIRAVRPRTVTFIKISGKQNQR